MEYCLKIVKKGGHEDTIKAVPIFNVCYTIVGAFVTFFFNPADIPEVCKHTSGSFLL